MTVRRLSPIDDVRAKKIWSVCFGDTDAFINEYFNTSVNFSDAFGYEENGELTAELFVLDFQAKLAGKFMDADFIAGCATMPEARKRGIMRELVKKAMLNARKCGKIAVYLHPFLHEFYRKFGFETISYVKRHTLLTKHILNEKVKIYTSVKSLPIEKMESAYTEYMKSFDNCFLRTHKRFCDWLQLLFSDGGKAVIYDDGDIFAYGLYYEEDTTAEVFELVACSEKAEMLLQTLAVERVNYFLPAQANEANNEEFTMMRVLDAMSMLKAARPVNTDVILHITDDFLNEEHNLLVRNIGNKNSVTAINAVADLKITVSELAALVAGADKNEHALWKTQSSCFFETY
ncbi:MAG: GNAT family N-acetyltransferase [Christensenella sp.]